MIDLNFKYKDLINNLTAESPFQPETAIVLGSGLGDFADSVKVIKTIETGSLPGYPPSTIEGHQGKIHFAEFDSKKLLLFQGRIHFYEGYSISESVLPAFISYKLNCKKLLLTNAAGGMNDMFKPGDLMLVNSFNGINIKKELADLIGLAGEKSKNYFIDFPSGEFNELIRQAAQEEKILLREGIYWYTKGPSYETPAEINMMRKFGGDAVGMSTVHEAVLGASLGVKVSCVSCITNYAAGISSQKLSHAEVTATANMVKDKFERLVKRIIMML